MRVDKKRVALGVKTDWNKAQSKLDQLKFSANNETNDDPAVTKEMDPRENPSQFESEAAKRLLNR